MRAAVDEEDKTKLIPGQVVNMTLYAFEGVVLFGKVGKIYDKAESDWCTFEVDVRVDPESPGFAALAGDDGRAGVCGFTQGHRDGRARAGLAGRLTVDDPRGKTRASPRGNRPAQRRAHRGHLETAPGLIVISPIGAMSEGQTVRQKPTDPTAAANLNTPKTQKAFRGL